MTLVQKLLTFALVCSCLLPAGTKAAEPPAKLVAIVDAAILPLMAQHDVPGMAVAITLNGEASFYNYGLASRAAHKPVNEHTLFELGSISKTFTATLASYAQVQGKLSLNDHPGRYMPELKGRAIDRAALIHLATYTAGGLPLQFPDEVEPKGMIAYFQQWRPSAAPGTRREYSNPSIGVLGHVTALALNSSFVEAMQTQLFPQLGLHDSYLQVPDAQMERYAWGHSKANAEIRVSPGVFAEQAYGVKSTAAEMIRYVQAQMDPQLLSVTMQRAIAGTQLGYFKVGEMVQGLGWEQYPFPITLDRLLAGNSEDMIFESNPAKRLSPAQMHAQSSRPTLFNKTGSTGGFGSYVLFVPELKIGIVMLANKNVEIPARIAAAHAILSQLAQLSTQSQQPAQPARPTTPPRP
ncbi:beta-lactamase [Paucibacter sp. TC2R-5]|uniref:class C beta-lactamase n=1 Tax=Paucibacter sp. TC2R-5 TaxID=2893555 RepID=UPI0021E3DD48|nr:class C beta-lactamase [Paucibacter sp. TC2R-5]MCV2360019.1 beta-lactamase [Paucibacter sp. TC2R-5]